MTRRLVGARRDQGARYLIITIAAFAVTVAGTRWYLDLAGYPTVGGGGLHVAHVLWGGLALFVAVLLPLLWVGRRALLISALLAGIGAGLFIDEVGKFLTTTNDYFFAPAAPIIYGSLLLLVLLWLVVRRREQDAFEATHAVVEALRQGVDGQLTREDRSRVTQALRTSGDALAHDGLEAQLLAVLGSPAMDERLANAGPIAGGSARRWLERVLPLRLERVLVYLGLVLSVLTALVAGFGLIALAAAPDLAVVQQADAGRLEFPDDPLWTFLLLAIYVATGLSAAIALALRGRGSAAWLDAALAAVLIDLVVGELVAFYAAQVTALAGAVWSVILLGLVLDLRYRSRTTPVGTPADAHRRQPDGGVERAGHG